jgi:ADP-heptose:LPS heptosyltransferase
VEVYEDTISYLEYYLNIVAAFGAPPITRKTEFIVSAEAEQWSEDFFRKIDFSKHHTLISIHPGASDPSKIWPADHFALLIQKLNSLRNTTIVLIQGPMERSIMEKIQQSISIPLCIVDTSSDVGIMAAIMKRSHLCIVNDSGARHLAVAVGTPTLTLFPDDKLPLWNFYYPEDGHHTILGKRNTGLDQSTPFLDSIPVDTVFNKVKEILKSP